MKVIRKEKLVFTGKKRGNQKSIGHILKNK
jgi:hypothetical protein